jgi:hypothetical protein
MRDRADSLEAWADSEREIQDQSTFLQTRPNVLAAIRSAFKKIGEKKLFRSNRAGLEHLDDDSLDGNRIAINEQVLRNYPDFENMPRADKRCAYARATADVYEEKRRTEAFCGETTNLFLAYIAASHPSLRKCFFKLNMAEGERDDPTSRDNEDDSGTEYDLYHKTDGDSHSFLLYTESEVVKTRIANDYNGLHLRQSAKAFSKLIFDNKESCLILDPWGEEKLIDLSDLADLDSAMFRIRSMAEGANLAWRKHGDGALMVMCEA